MPSLNGQEHAVGCANVWHQRRKGGRTTAALAWLQRWNREVQDGCSKKVAESAEFAEKVEKFQKAEKARKKERLEKVRKEERLAELRETRKQPMSGTTRVGYAGHYLENWTDLEDLSRAEVEKGLRAAEDRSEKEARRRGEEEKRTYAIITGGGKVTKRMERREASPYRKEALTRADREEIQRRLGVAKSSADTRTARELREHAKDRRTRPVGKAKEHRRKRRRGNRRTKSEKKRRAMQRKAEKRRRWRNKKVLEPVAVVVVGRRRPRWRRRRPKKQAEANEDEDFFEACDEFLKNSGNEFEAVCQQSQDFFESPFPWEKFKGVAKQGGVPGGGSKKFLWYYQSSFRISKDSYMFVSLPGIASEKW